jgi:FkbM family methyltransferase
LPAGDTVSLEPLIFGTYEEGVRKLVEHFSQQGYRDALFDIGANIGLSTVFCGEYFEQVFCFEPNPVLFDVLRANTRTLSYKTTLFDFGLGRDDRSSILRVPHHNVGGGYVADADNTLSADELTKKDGVSQGGRNDSYLSMQVQIKNGRAVLEGILSKLRPDAKLLFKIDVEGYEKVVLIEIAKALRPSHSAVIVFENFSDEITPVFIRSIFPNLKSIERLSTNLEKLPSKLHKFVRALTSGRIYQLEPEPAKLLGEVVLTIR